MKQQQPSQQITDVKFYKTFELTNSEEEKDNNGGPVITKIELKDEVKNITTTIKTLEELQTHVKQNFSKWANSKGNLYVEFKLNNKIYRREINKYGVLIGTGAIIYSDGGKYVGEFNKDLRRHGKGTLFSPNGKIEYKGGWEEDKFEGQGTYYYPNGKIQYNGEWKEGKKHGKGTYVIVNGDKYEGYWKKDLADGYGVYTWPDGSKYEGEFKENQKHGNGTYYFNNDKYIIGTWNQDSPIENQGYIFNENNKAVITTDKDNNIISITTADNTIYKVDGKQYKLQVVDKRNIIIIHNDKNISIEELIAANNNLLTTEKDLTTTVYFPPSGVKYTGKVKDGKMIGKGTLSWYDFKNNRIITYEGIFQDGICNNGILTIKDKQLGEVIKTRRYLGHKINQTSNVDDITLLPTTEEDLNKKYPIYDGNFDPNTGELKGQGKITWSDGSTYTGTFYNGKSIEGELVLKNGNKQPMVYQNYSRGINQDDIQQTPPKPAIDNILYFTNYSWFKASCCNNNSCERFDYQENEISGLPQKNY